MQYERPRVVYIVNSLNAGGTEKLVVDMGLAFAGEFNVAVLCLDELGIWAENLRDGNVSVNCLWRQPGLDLSMAVKMANYFRSHQVQLVHAHQYSSWFYAALSRFMYHRPCLILEEHGRFYPEKKKRKRMLFNRIFLQAQTDRIIAVSRDIQHRLIEYEGLKGDKVEVIYNGVNQGASISSAERSDFRWRFGFGPTDFVIGAVGRFDAIKNLPLLINSLSLARREIPSIRGLLIGDGPEYGEIKALVERVGLGDSVQLGGFRDDVGTLLQCLDLFVLPSFSEGTSVALLEAMAAGVPVVVTAVGGNPELVSDGNTGWVVPSDSVECLTAAVIEAVRNPSKRREFCRRGRLRYERSFTFDSMIEKYRKIYRGLLVC